MTWNLMCRSRNTVNIMMEHISFNGDSMTVQFAHTKCDMSGARAWHKWHIFANPGRPEICPILSLARYRATFPQIRKGALFPGGAQYRFRSLLNNHILPANAAASSDSESSPRTLVSIRSAKALPPTAATVRQPASPLLPFAFYNEHVYVWRSG
jgi:hypothetical protein